MSSILTSRLRNLVTKAFVNLFSGDDSIYIGVGKSTPWGGEDIPPVPVNNDELIVNVPDDIISLKRIDPSSMAISIRRYDWDESQSTIYSSYDPTKTFDDYISPFYVISDSKIYKCLNNNSGAISTVKPVDTGVDAFVTSDGYTWKLMGELDASDSVRFMTNRYVPIRENPSVGSIQSLIMENAKKNSISTIVVENGGSGYTEATVSIDAPTSGVAATATPLIENGEIVAIHLSVIGEGYDSVPAITITGDGEGAVAKCIMAPRDGHGANILNELDASYVVINSRFEGNELGYFLQGDISEFRQISIIANPLDVNGNLAKKQRYISKGHPEWTGDETGAFAEVDPKTGDAIYIENISPVIRSDGQIEDIKIAIKF